MKTIPEWVEILGKADATDCSAEIGAAHVIIGSLLGYNKSARAHARVRDVAELAKALEAYALMLQRAGVKVHDPEEPCPSSPTSTSTSTGA